MATTVVFEVAALADALTKAARVAPTRGDAFTKAAGIVLDVTSDEAIVMATDTLVRYSTWLTPESFEGEPASWRLPSRIFADVISKLKTTQTKTVKLVQEGGRLRLEHGRTRAQFNLIDMDEYPRWMPFSPDDMTEVEGLARAVSAVDWASADKGDPPLIGVLLTGQQAVASDRYKFASMPCQIDLEEPIVIPPAVITSILKPTMNVMIRVEGSQVYIMPDDFTQIALTAYGTPFPPVARVMNRSWPTMVKVNRHALIDMIELVMSMSGADRMPTVVLIFGRQEIAAMLANQEVGLLGHIVDTPGQLAFTKRHEMRFKPEYLLGALNGCQAAEITLGFDMENPKAPVYIDGGDGLEFWIAPRQKIDESADE